MNLRSPLVPLVASLALAVSAFLPWLRLGDVGLAGVPDPAGLFVLALGVVGTALSLARLVARRDTRQWLMLVGLAALTTLIVVWRTGPMTIADRAQAHAEAVALVDNVPTPPVPPVSIGIGVLLGMLSALVLLLTTIRASSPTPKSAVSRPVPPAPSSAPADPTAD